MVVTATKYTYEGLKILTFAMRSKGCMIIVVSLLASTMKCTILRLKPALDASQARRTDARSR